ncbi:MAG: hypothetical protein ACON4Z_07080 [Planctomycetota bacterium]
MLKILTTLALSTTCLLAQQVRAFDELAVENGVYSLETSGWELVPGAIDLTLLVDELVEVTGTLDTSGAVPVLTLASAALADDAFEVDGTSQIGTTLDLNVESHAGTFCFLLGGQAGDAAPLDPLGLAQYSGTSFLQLPAVMVASGPIVNEAFTHQLAIPNNPALVGAGLRLQAGVYAGGVVLINAADIEVEP